MTPTGPALAEALGHPSDTRLVIIQAAELGLCHAVNDGVYDALRRGLATTASLMVPAPWAREALARYRGEDVGVHLTLTAEYERYRWGPVTLSPSLLDGDGGFPRTPSDLFEHADVDEVRRELRSQIDRAVVWGFDITHLDVRADPLLARPELFDVHLELAYETGLPLRLPADPMVAAAGFPMRQLAADDGVVVPDSVLHLATDDRRGGLDAALADLPAGLTVLRYTPAFDAPELRALMPEWSSRVADHDEIKVGSDLDGLLDRLGAVRIDFTPVRALQRSLR